MNPELSGGARIVIDTNVYVSALLRRTSIPGIAVVRAWTEATTLVSSATLLELRATLSKQKLSRYLKPHDIEPYIEQVRSIAEQVAIRSIIRACRHPKDDKFLELAVDGRADLILTGDNDLLALHPFRGIAILRPAEFLEHSR